MNPCRWGMAGLPSCRAGTRGTRYWCAACAPLLDPRVIPPASGDTAGDASDDKHADRTEEW